VVVPPSIHETGQSYAWIDPLRHAADAPAWLIELLTDKTGKQSIPTSERFGILTEGRRNDGLARYGGALRRKGAELAELEEKLLSYNAHHCQPLLEEKEVRKVAASIARYPVGGPDPLELSWQAVQTESHQTRTAQFVGLCRHLQRVRPEHSIALPIERIGELMGVHWTTVSNYRKDAVRRGWLMPVEQYIAHRRAGHYRLIESQIPTETETLTKSLPALSSGLVRIHDEIRPSENGGNSSSENCPTTPQMERGQAVNPREGAFPHCPECASFALYRQNNAGDYECLTCGLLGIEERKARRVD
jgi:hypothetical protein